MRRSSSGTTNRDQDGCPQHRTARIRYVIAINKSAKHTPAIKKPKPSDTIWLLRSVKMPVRAVSATHASYNCSARRSRTSADLVIQQPQQSVDPFPKLLHRRDQAQ